MRTENTLKECFHAALAAIHRELPSGAICGYLFQKGKGKKALETQERATCIWQVLGLESINDFVYILSVIGIPKVKIRTNGTFQGGTELQAYIKKNKDLESIVAVRELRCGSSIHFCFLQSNSSKIADYATVPSKFKRSIIEIKALQIELASRKAPTSSAVSPCDPSYGEDHIKSTDDGGAPPPGTTHFLPDRPRPRGVLPTFVETGLSTGMPPSNDGGYVTALISPFDPCQGTSTHFLPGPGLEDFYLAAAGETACLRSGKPPSNDNSYASSVSSPFNSMPMLYLRPTIDSHTPLDSRLDHHSQARNLSTDMFSPSETNGYAPSLNTRDVHIIEGEAVDKQNKGTVNLNIVWDCAKHPLPKKTIDVAGQSLYIPPKYVCIPKSQHTKLQKYEKKAERFDAILDALKKKKFTGDTLSKRQLGSVMAIFASLTLVPCEVCTYMIVLCAFERF